MKKIDIPLDQFPAQWANINRDATYLGRKVFPNGKFEYELLFIDHDDGDDIVEGKGIVFRNEDGDMYDSIKTVNVFKDVYELPSWLPPLALTDTK